MATHPLNVGFIGCGRIATLHQLGYINNPHAKLTAICSTNKNELSNAAHNWGVDQIYTDYHQLLNNPEIDVVEILTPHNTHFQIATDTARARKHLSLQKVPVMTLNEYDELIKVVKQNQVKFRVFENFRFHKPYQRALELVNSKKMGKVKTINQRMWASLKTSKEWP
jgi:predicted dehydrogenase